MKFEKNKILIINGLRNICSQIFQISAFFKIFVKLGLGRHVDREDNTAWFFYAMAGLAGLAMKVPRKWLSAAVPLAVSSAMEGIVCTGVRRRCSGGWLGAA